MMRPHWSKRTLALRSSTGVKRCSPVVCDENCWNCQSWLKKASSCLLVDLLGHVRAVDRLCMVLLCFVVLVPVCISKDGANGHWSSFALHWDGNMALYGTVKQHEAMHQAMQLKRWRICHRMSPICHRHGLGPHPWDSCGFLIPCPPEVAKEASDMVRFSAEWKPIQDPSRSDISWCLDRDGQSAFSNFSLLIFVNASEMFSLEKCLSVTFSVSVAVWFTVIFSRKGSLMWRIDESILSVSCRVVSGMSRTQGSGGRQLCHNCRRRGGGEVNLQQHEGSRHSPYQRYLQWYLKS